jgi:hypothetical protein
VILKTCRGVRAITMFSLPWSRCSERESAMTSRGVLLSDNRKCCKHSSYIKNKVWRVSHHRLTRRINDSATGGHFMPKSFTPPTEFRPELVSTLRSILDNAVNQIAIANRTSATKAKMAERILRAASDGITDPAILIAMAIEDGKQPSE